MRDVWRGDQAWARERRTGTWVDDPDLGAYVYKGEPGATRISEAEAARLERLLLRNDTTWYRVDSLPDRTVPAGLFRITHDEQGHIRSYETFNQRTCQWVDDPSKSAYVFMGEPGATRITEAEAADLERRLCRASDP